MFEMVLRLQEALDLKVSHAAFSLSFLFLFFVFLRGVGVCGGGGEGVAVLSFFNRKRKQTTVSL